MDDTVEIGLLHEPGAPDRTCRQNDGVPFVATPQQTISHRPISMYIFSPQLNRYNAVEKDSVVSSLIVVF